MLHQLLVTEPRKLDFDPYAAFSTFVVFQSFRHLATIGCVHGVFASPCFVSGHLNTGLRRVPLPKGKKLHRDFTLDKTLYIVKSLYKKPGRTTPEKKHEDRKSTRLNSSHVRISYAVFCLKKKKKKKKNKK